MNSNNTQLPRQTNNTQLTISDTISKCLVVFYLKKVTPDVATIRYMDKFFGVSTESINQVKKYPIQDPNTTVIFIEMISSVIATFAYNQWKTNNSDKDVLVYTASDFLCSVAAKKFHQPSFNNPGSAFHALFKPNTLSALMFQQPQQVQITASNQSNTAPIQQPQVRNNPFSFRFNIPQQQSRPPPLNDLYTSAAPGTSYPLSAPIQQYTNYTPHVSMPQTYNASLQMFEQSLNSPYVVQQQPQLQQQQQQYPPNYFTFPQNPPYDNSNFMYPPNNQNGYY
jgi:hypothetical protein|uniref:Uncharacterized protein n=1 Tax=Panagrolaimus sp. PS1159 TaxID=55785 RepID=A0AC35GHS2_9BILA